MFARQLLREIGRQRRLFAFLATVALGLVVLAFLSRNWELVLSMTSRNNICLPMMAALVLNSLICRAVAFRQLLMDPVPRLNLKQYFHLFSVSNMISCVTMPGVGWVYRGLQLWKYEEIPVSRYILVSSTVEALGLLTWCSLCLVGLSAASHQDRSKAVAWVSVAFGVVVLAIACGVAAKAWQRLGEHRGETTTFRFVRNLTFAFLVLFYCSIVQLICFSLAFGGFGLDAANSDFTVVVSAHQLSGVVGLTPGGVGIQEFAAAGASKYCQMNTAEITAGFLITRMMRVSCAVAIGVVSFFFLKQVRRPCSD